MMDLKLLKRVKACKMVSGCHVCLTSGGGADEMVSPVHIMYY